jgi:hypothetical protein
VDVTDDLRFNQQPMPSDCYPILASFSVPWFAINSMFPNGINIPGFAYEWHQEPESLDDNWYVGVVDTRAAERIASARCASPQQRSSL